MKQTIAKSWALPALVGVFLLAACRPTGPKYEVTNVEGGMVSIDSVWDAHPDADAVALLKPYKQKLDSLMNEVIGVSAMKMDKDKPESLLSNLVAEVLRTSASHVLQHPADLGIMNIGGLRNILPQGDITVDEVYEILPFENSLCVLTLKGTVLRHVLEDIAAQHGQGLSGARLEISKEGKLLSATVQGKPIVDEKEYTIATIDYLAEGNDGLPSLLQAEKRDCPDGMTLRGLFLNYVRQQTAAGKQITSALDGRITIK
ncbi:MAG: 5'-nucleotidase C-terminal domain-containing protein [Mediterranea sp.]|jgi:2',3'-cyclic-nucleotide 2'-phosphodiesterase (5'-nucleotidase family)|nr:5'-nucleotidase C-terminal domain-containing protein [Mediterranea sp.]